jgi:Carboxyl transferase domain
VSADSALSEFLARLAPDWTAVRAGPTTRTRRGHVISVVSGDQEGNGGQLRRALRRGLPVVLVARPGAGASLRMLPSGWQHTGSLTAPTIAVILSGENGPALAHQPGSGPDLVARLEPDGSDGLAGADLRASSPAGLADAIDEALDVLQAGPDRHSADPDGSGGAGLAQVVPLEPGVGYPMEPVLERLLDRGQLVELARSGPAEVITGFATVRGTPIAVLASRPDQNHGLLTVAGMRRIARFLEIAGRLGTPLLSVVDSGGVAWEVQPDMLETFRDCLLAMYNLGVPRFILLAGDAFGAAASLYGLGMRADLVSAWPRARIAADTEVDPADSSVLAAARAGLVPDVIHPDETYAWLHDVMAIGVAAGSQEAVRG